MIKGQLTGSEITIYEGEIHKKGSSPESENSELFETHWKFTLYESNVCVSQPNLVQDLDRRAVHSNLSYLASNTSCEFSFRDDDDDSDLTIANSGC